MDNKYDKNGFDRNGYNQFGYDKFGYDKNGFDKDGYDRRGFNAEGFNKLTGLDKDGFDRDGFDRDGYDKFGFGSDGYNKEGFDKDGYDRDGYNKNGYDKNGYDYEGYNRAGFDREGFNKDGFDKDGYGHDGFNKDGYDRAGYNKSGYDKQGYNKKGLDKYGFNIDGVDADGLDIFGRDKDGYGLDGFDKDGYNREGYNRDGFHKDDFDSDGFNKYSGLNIDGYDRDGFNINGLDKNGYDREGYGLDGYNKDGYNRDGYNKDGYDYDGYNKDGYDRYGYDRDGFNGLGLDWEGYDRSGYNVDGYDRDGFNHMGLTQDGYDKTGARESEKEDETADDVQLRSGLRIKRKSDGERGCIDTVGKTVIYYTLDMYRGTGTRTYASIENFKQIFTIEVDKKGKEREREALYNTRVRKYLSSDYCKNVLIPIEESKAHPKNISRVEDGQVIIERVTDELQIKLDAERAAKEIANEAYFAHVDCNENPDLYIGKKEIPGYVIDWADKQAAYYYEYKIYSVDLELGINFVRDITLKNGMFFDFNDLYNRNQSQTNDSNSVYASVADEKLIEIIERNRASKSIHDIVATIQEKQYKIITQDMNKNILVLGCAGSGKTMILLHRIRYVLFNNSDVDCNSVIVVSPTDILGRESKELSKILNIEKINQCSTAEFYAQIVKELFESNNMFHRTQEFKINDFNTHIEDSIINNCLDIIDDNYNKKQQYVGNKRENLLKEKSEVESYMEGLEKNSVNELYNDAIKEIAYFSKNDITAIINFSSNKIEKDLVLKENRKLAITYLLECKRKGKSTEEKAESNDSKPANDDLLKCFDNVDFVKFIPIAKETKRPVVRFVQTMGSISNVFNNQEDIKRVIEKINNCTYNELENFAKELSNDIEQLKKLEKISNILEYAVDVVDTCNTKDTIEMASIQMVLDRFEKTFLFAERVENVPSIISANPFALFGEYNDILNEFDIINNAEDSNDFVFDMLINMLNVKRDRKNHIISINKYQLQKIFNIMVQKFVVSNNNKHYIYLDEFQDYSTEELSDIQQYYNNAVINLYGDVNQCINAKGIDNLKALQGVMAFDEEYELRENYRNSSEITEYVNNRFNMDMYKIGLPGSVKESQGLNLDEVENDDRAAIIVADDSILPFLQISETKDKVCYYNEEGCIRKNIYNVMNVAQAKGLEFEKVIVVDKDMTKNQLYVACTRAIRELNVVTLQEPQEESLKPEVFDEEGQRGECRNKKLCQHCGGEFRGLFTRVCKECGRAKDY